MTDSRQAQIAYVQAVNAARAERDAAVLAANAELQAAVTLAERRFYQKVEAATRERDSALADSEHVHGDDGVTRVLTPLGGDHRAAVARAAKCRGHR